MVEDSSAQDLTEEEKQAYEKLKGKFSLSPKKSKLLKAKTPTEQKEPFSNKTPQKTQEQQNLFSYTLKILSQEKYITLAIIWTIAFLILYSFLYGFWKLPIIQFGFNRMSQIIWFDIVFLLLISILAAILVTLIKFKVDNNAGSKLGAAGGVFAGFVAAFCPVCQGITIVALGGTLTAIPLGFLVPYFRVLQVAALFVLGLSLYLVAESIYTKTCPSCILPTKKQTHKATKISPTITNEEPFLYKNNIAFGSLIVLVLMLLLNSFLFSRAFALSSNSASSGGSIVLKPGFEYGPTLTLKPMPLGAGESPRISGYKTIVKPLPTISELAITPSTGDLAQDLVNNVVPRGTPWYGAEAGVSFDDPIAAQKLWAKGRGIQLGAEEQKRWDRIVNSFTCDYCCGSPQNPTIITRCGCAHSAAAQGMAKWFIKNNGNKYSDEQIYGEMARWYALWYPGPTVKRIAQELEVA